MLRSLQLVSQICHLVLETQTTSASQQELRDEREEVNSNVKETA